MSIYCHSVKLKNRRHKFVNEKRFCKVVMILKKAVCQPEVDSSVADTVDCGSGCLLVNVYGTYRTEFAACSLCTDFECTRLVQY